MRNFGHTEEVREQYLRFADELRLKQDLDRLEAKNRIENMEENASLEDWKELFRSIREDYTCSARYFLMDFLFHHAAVRPEEDGGYTCIFQGEEYTFQEPAPEHARRLSDEERDLYIRLLSRIAADNHGDPVKLWRPVMRKAMLWYKNAGLLTRQEGFQIAHGLKFSLEQTQSFLVRVLENDGLRQGSSEDLIEMFCFLWKPANNWHTAEELKAFYRRSTKDVPKKESSARPEHFTRELSHTLQKLVGEWEKDLDTDMMERFKAWLLEQAPFLDVPGRSARAVYRRLTGLAYEWTVSLRKDMEEDAVDSLHVTPAGADVPVLDDICDYICDCCEDEEYDLAENDLEKVRSALLMYADNELFARKGCRPELTWRYLTLNKKGELASAIIGERIPALLSGEEPVGKADLLFMLWYVCDLLWSFQCVDEENQYDILFLRIDNFMSLSEKLLDQAMLPPFYAPHLLERSFLSAICVPADADESPFEVYEQICREVLGRSQEIKEEREEDEASAQDASCRWEGTSEAMRETGEEAFGEEGSPAFAEERKTPRVIRRAWEKEVKDARGCFLQGVSYPDPAFSEETFREILEIGERLAPYFLKSAKKNAKYLFGPRGVRYHDPQYVGDVRDQDIPGIYPSGTTGELFDQERADYREEIEEEKRYKFLYGLTLSLTEAAAGEGRTCDLRINYLKNTVLTVIKWENSKKPPRKRTPYGS